MKFDKKTCVDVNDDKALRDLTALPTTLFLYTADGQSLSLENWYRGKSVFLVCGGPSLLSLDLGQLRRPGVVTFGINNVWSVFRPNLWCCVDRPGNFIDTGWKDPTIIKFAPLGKIDNHLHIKNKKGKWGNSSFKLKQMPSTFFFRRNERFQPDRFFTEGSVNWGNHGSVSDAQGFKGSRSVMLAAFRLMYYLGFKKIFIVGADFKMRHSPQEKAVRNYAWKQWRHDSSVKGNNSTYEALNSRFRQLLPHLEKAGIEVHNCTPGGNLTAFPRMDYSKAVDLVAAECEKPVDTEGYYNHDFGK